MRPWIPGHIRIADVMAMLPNELMLRGIDDELYFAPVACVVPAGIRPRPGSLVSIEDGVAVIRTDSRDHGDIPADLVDAQVQADIEAGRPVHKESQGGLALRFNRQYPERLDLLNSQRKAA